MRNILKITIITLFITIFIGCGGGGGGSSSNDTTDTTETNSTTENSQIIVTLQNCEVYTDVETDDVVIQDEINTTIKTVFNTDGTKKICVLTGAAHILRD